MIWYFTGINIFSFIIYGIDKLLAKKKLFRVSEYSLLMFSVFGGPIGSILGMQIFHHKTRKLLFWGINILCLTVWSLIIIESV